MICNYDLQRFLAAQDQVYAAVLGELRVGRKSSHWMWFIFQGQRKGVGNLFLMNHSLVDTWKSSLRRL